ERRPVRAHGDGLDRRSGSRAPHRRAHQGGNGRDQHAVHRVPRHPVRGLQAVGLRARARARDARPLPRDEERHRLDRRTSDQPLRPLSRRSGMLGAIGGTPIVRLERLVEPGMAEVWVKLESSNPTGSYKDRMALAMIEGAEPDGRLQPGQGVVEYTGGSTGSSLAYVCALKGYPLRIVSSDAYAREKLLTIEAFGATLEVLPSPEGVTPQLVPRMMERAREIVGETGGFATDQFNNRDMLAVYGGLGRELLDQLDGRIDAYCGYIGTAGCFVGGTHALRERL